jgi:hypothetical protein
MGFGIARRVGKQGRDIKRTRAARSGIHGAKSGQFSAIPVIMDRREEGGGVC